MGYPDLVGEKSAAIGHGVPKLPNAELSGDGAIIRGSVLPSNSDKRGLNLLNSTKGTTTTTTTTTISKTTSVESLKNPSKMVTQMVLSPNISTTKPFNHLGWSLLQQSLAHHLLRKS
ncbi:hypothetical protein NC651_016115 [Populus alba x Populus x berolinensis]|nr:hypothetical protein NC651_016115 [Populus alba x Populus x berolinensis]